MNADRRMRLWNLVAEQAHGEPATIGDVCVVTISVCAVDRGAVTVMLPANPHETLWASDQVASELEELVLTLGEGPCVEARAGGPMLVADLAAPGCLVRWPVFAPAAVQAGVRAVFALPLQVGAIRLGTLDLYRAQPGSLDPEQLADVLVLADTVCALLLDEAHRDRPYPDGYLPEQVGGQHPVVHQATGMILVQLGVTAAVALTRLRAYAFAHDRRLSEVAGDVVARRLRFHPDPDPGTEGGG